MSEQQQLYTTDRQLWDDPLVKIVTSARPFRRWLGILGALVDEAKLHADGDGIHIRAVDPANVGMVSVDWKASGDGVYNWNGDEEVLAGFNIKHLRKFAQFARLNRDDPLSFYIGRRDPDESVTDEEGYLLGMRITRPDSRIQRQSTYPHIDPDSIRQEPDLPDVDEEQPWAATISAKGFDAAMRAVQSDHVKVSNESDTLVIDGSLEIGSDQFLFADTVEPRYEDPEPAGSIYSLDYIRDMASGIKLLGVDEVTLHVGREYPVSILFEQEEWGIEGEYLLAPRITGEG